MKLKMFIRTFLALSLSAKIILAKDTENQNSKRFLVVNGGYSDTSNFSYAEETAVLMRNIFFKGKAQLLYANGAQTKVVKMSSDGFFNRDELGMLNPTPTTISFPFIKADKASIKKYYNGLSLEKPKEVTAAFFDHGGSAGVALWGQGRGEDTTLTALELRTLEKYFPSETIVRSIHSHCHSGAMLVDPNRQLPKSIDNIDKFVTSNYFFNRCGFSDADHSQSIVNHLYYNPWEKSVWGACLSNTSTLASIRNCFASSPLVDSTPLLTSDYLAHDIVETICQSPLKKKKKDDKDCDCDSKNQSPTEIKLNKKNSLLVKTVSKITNKYFDLTSCEAPELLETKKIKNEIKDNEIISNAFYYAEKFWKIEYIKSKHPGIYEKYDNAVVGIDTARTLLSKTPKNQKKRILELTNLIAKLEKDALEYDQISEVVEVDDDDKNDFNNFFNSHCTLAWPESGEEKYSPLFDYLNKNNVAKLSTLKKALSSLWDQLQKDSRNAELKARDTRRSLAEHWMNLASPKGKTKAIYDSIQKCENTSIH